MGDLGADPLPLGRLHRDGRRDVDGSLAWGMPPRDRHHLDARRAAVGRPHARRRQPARVGPATVDRAGFLQAVLGWGRAGRAPSITSRGRAKLREIDTLASLPGRRRFDPVGCLAASEKNALLSLLDKLNAHLAAAPWRSVAEGGDS